MDFKINWWPWVTMNDLWVHIRNFFKICFFIIIASRITESGVTESQVCFVSYRRTQITLKIPLGKNTPLLSSRNKIQGGNVALWSLPIFHPTSSFIISQFNLIPWTPGKKYSIIIFKKQNTGWKCSIVKSPYISSDFILYLSIQFNSVDPWEEMLNYCLQGAKYRVEM